MKKYEEPAMEVLTIIRDEVFTVGKSEGDGNSYEGEW